MDCCVTFVAPEAPEALRDVESTTRGALEHFQSANAGNNTIYNNKPVKELIK